MQQLDIAARVISNKLPNAEIVVAHSVTRECIQVACILRHGDWNTETLVSTHEIPLAADIELEANRIAAAISQDIEWAASQPIVQIDRQG